TQTELAQTHFQLQQTQTELQFVQSQMYQRPQQELQLHQLQERILAMESSKFWKLRGAWFKFKKTLGLKDKE
ncbi:MAG: methyltransferase, partial [Scytonema sp. PMC 1070.18]|nr:methyltransferase [Scytonema sp. PMC 1070.18]